MQKVCRFCLIGAKCFKAGLVVFLSHTLSNKVHKVVVIAILNFLVILAILIAFLSALSIK